MRWLPRVYTTGWLGCDVDVEHEGHSLVIEWLGLYLEIVIVIARRSRS